MGGGTVQGSIVVSHEKDGIGNHGNDGDKKKKTRINDKGKKAKGQIKRIDYTWMERGSRVVVYGHLERLGRGHHNE